MIQKKITRLLIWIGIAITCASGTAFAAKVPKSLTLDASSPQTPQELWAGYDPRSEPLEIEIIKEWTEDGAHYKEFYFRGEVHDGKPVRVYAIYAAPVGGKNLPALLHIHGGGQSASPYWLKFWTARGYAAMTFDFTGKHAGREHYTDYGDLFNGKKFNLQNMQETTESSLRGSKWYHWVLLSRRCLTVLERMPEVDPQRLGIYGISVGGSLVWYVAGIDDRVKATCPIYGCGWNTHPKSIYADDPKKDDPSTILWRKTMEPEAYAPLITHPVLFLDGTSDHHGKMDWAYKTLASLKAPWYAAFTPYYRHHIEEEQGLDLPLFMDHYLRGGPAWPKSPELKIVLDASGVPRAILNPDTSQKIKKVEIYYALRNENPITRYWRLTDSSRRDNEWIAALPISNPQDRLFGFANVIYESGICLTSDFQAVRPADLGAAKATDIPSLLIGDFSHGLDGFTTSSPGTDPNRFNKVIETTIGPDGIPGLHKIGRVILRTQKLNDPKWRAPAGAKLSFLIRVPRAVEFEVVLVENDYSLDSKNYSHRVRLGEKAGWQEVVLGPEDFKNEKNNQALASWRPFDSLDFGSKDSENTEGVTFAKIRWVVPNSP